MMAGDDDELQSLSTRMCTAEKEVRAINSTLDNVVQELERFSLKIDDWSLTDGMYLSGHDRQSTHLPPPPPPHVNLHHITLHHINHHLIIHDNINSNISYLSFLDNINNLFNLNFHGDLNDVILLMIPR